MFFRRMPENMLRQTARIRTSAPPAGCPIIRFPGKTVWTRFVNCGICRSLQILLDLQEIRIVRHISPALPGRRSQRRMTDAFTRYKYKTQPFGARFPQSFRRTRRSEGCKADSSILAEKKPWSARVKSPAAHPKAFALVMRAEHRPQLLQKTTCRAGNPQKAFAVNIQ